MRVDYIYILGVVQGAGIFNFCNWNFIKLHTKLRYTPMFYFPICCVYQILYSRSFEMNLWQTYMGQTFYVGCMRGILAYGNCLSPSKLAVFVRPRLLLKTHPWITQIIEVPSLIFLQCHMSQNWVSVSHMEIDSLLEICNISDSDFLSNCSSIVMTVGTGVSFMPPNVMWASLWTNNTKRTLQMTSKWVHR